MTQKRTRRRSQPKRYRFSAATTLSGMVLLVVMITTFHLAGAKTASAPQGFFVDPNLGVKTLVTEFFEANDAPEMIPIIKCESRFRHYARDGSVLVNKSGSSATGVAQILASTHPDPRIIERYNRDFDMEMTVKDFDIETLEGNLGYALVLYQVNGTKDWECSKRFQW